MTHPASSPSAVLSSTHNCSGTSAPFPYYFGLTSQWQRANGGNFNGTFGSHATFTVAAGKKIQAVTQITGSLLGAHCEIFGTLS